MDDAAKVAAVQCGAESSGSAFETYPVKEVKLGRLSVDRALPIRSRRLVGPWCFLDRFGPTMFTDEKPMDVAPHPHIGLQTVTWLLEGEILHDDSLGCEAVARPGSVNVMTSGRGISHAEQTPRENSGLLSGVQLWTALPDLHRHRAPSFQAVARVPSVESRGGAIQVFAGTLAGETSPAQYFSEIVGAEIAVRAGESIGVDLNPTFEHAALLLTGDGAIEGRPLQTKQMAYLGDCRSGATFTSRDGGRILLIGGPPFQESILMWWNFVARTPQEMIEARQAWSERDTVRFGEVRAYQGPRLEAPELTRFASPNPAS